MYKLSNHPTFPAAEKNRCLMYQSRYLNDAEEKAKKPIP